MKNSCQTSEARIYKKLVETPLFQTYRDAFINATGMSLILAPIEADIGIAPQNRAFQTPFCERINDGKISNCGECCAADRCLRESVSNRPETTTCFAKMRETAIPIRAGERTIALLKTGQVFTKEQPEDAFESVAECLLMRGRSASEIEQLCEEWKQTRVVSTNQYEGTITLLAAFALQLSDLLNRLMLEETHAEPEVVTRAKRYINSHLEDKVCLETVATHVGVSSFYFCKLFKQSTEMTLTEYVNRRRVEWAKRMLLNPQSRVTEIAYEVGYQSLSQFNRSFLKYVGVSPTGFREQKVAA